MPRKALTPTLGRPYFEVIAVEQSVGTTEINLRGLTKDATGLGSDTLPFTPLTNTGSREMNVNGAVTPVDFALTPPTNNVWLIKELVYIIQDNGLTLSKFGGLTALTNGCQLLWTRDNDTQLDFTSGFPLKTNMDVLSLIDSGDTMAELLTTDTIRVSIDMTQFTGYAFPLDGRRLDELVFRVRDDLTGLAFHRMTAIGWSERSYAVGA